MKKENIVKEKQENIVNRRHHFPPHTEHSRFRDVVLLGGWDENVRIPFFRKNSFSFSWEKNMDKMEELSFCRIKTKLYDIFRENIVPTQVKARIFAFLAFCSLSLLYVL